MGGMILDQEVLKDMAKNHFQDLHKEEGEYSPWQLNNRFSIIEEGALEEVKKPFSYEKFNQQVFSMGSFKALGPDGLHLIFFQANWPMFIVVIIPKCDAPNSLHQFHPISVISVCNMIYKIITKIIATRLKKFMPMLVGPNQCSFFLGRHATNSVVFAQEIFYSIHKKNEKYGFMIVKVDLEKGYDKLIWDFLIDTLKEVGFIDHFCKLFFLVFPLSICRFFSMEYLLVNFHLLEELGKLTQFHHTFCFKYGKTSHLIKREVACNNWKPIMLCR
ncbi:hypothetical protein CR513_04616, partial [Mucuna pruriens]